MSDVAFLPAGKREQTKVQNRQAILDAVGRTVGSHHQKAVVIQNADGRLAFVGAGFAALAATVVPTRATIFAARAAVAATATTATVCSKPCTKCGITTITTISTCCTGCTAQAEP